MGCHLECTMDVPIAPQQARRHAIFLVIKIISCYAVMRHVKQKEKLIFEERVKVFELDGSRKEIALRAMNNAFSPLIVGTT